jgi:hypothetical protein
MKSALPIAAFALLLAVTAAVLVGVYDVHQIARAAKQTISSLNDALVTANKTLTVIDADAEAQKANLKTIGDDAAKTGTDTRRVVDHFDRVLTRINTKTLGQLEEQISGNGSELQATLKTLNAGIGTLGATATGTLGKLGETADGVTAVTKSLEIRIADPRIDELIGHFNTVSGSLDAISVNAVAMSADMRIDIHRMSQPPSKLHTALDVVWTGAKFGSLFIP